MTISFWAVETFWPVESSSLEFMGYSLFEMNIGAKIIMTEIHRFFRRVRLNQYTRLTRNQNPTLEIPIYCGRQYNI
jgi:hypothetical protein